MFDKYSTSDNTACNNGSDKNDFSVTSRHVSDGAEMHLQLGRSFKAGSTCSIYSAIADALSYDIVAKVFNAPGFESAAQTECAITNLICDERVPSCVAFGFTKMDHPVLVFPRCDGVPLSSLIRRFHGKHAAGKTRRVSLLVRLLNCVIHVCEVLETAHQHTRRFAVTHGDIQSSNIIVGKNGTTRLLDWGNGTLSDATSEEAAARKAIDIFMVGDLLSDILLNLQNTRFRLDSAGNVVDAELPKLSAFEGVVHTAGDICIKALSPRRKERYTTPGALAIDLADAVTELSKRLRDEPPSISVHQASRGLFHQTVAGGGT